MCSNTSSTSGAGVSGSGGDDGDYASIILKKPKRQRVPKRGPGVAELEKILREQESKNHADKGNVPFVPDQNHHLSPPPPPPMTMLYSNVGKNNAFSGGVNGGNNGVRIGGSGIILPEQALLPTVWSSSESSIHEEAPKIPAGYPFSTNFVHGSDQIHQSPLMLQKKHCQYASPTINLFPHSGSLPSISDNPSAGLYVHLEPPSNQRSSHHMYSSLLPEEEKMIGTKRPRTFSLENNSGPPMFHCQVPSPFSHKHTLDQSPSSCNHPPPFNLRRDDTVVFRDPPKKFITEYGAPNGNFVLFGSPATPSPLALTSPQEFSRYSSLSFQESISEGSHQMPSHGESVHRKPFYSFLNPDEQTGNEEEETTLSLDSERSGGGARTETVDLNLKL